ncbi:hypothetical protein RUM44_002283 [Polyplax serrata]|uniref:Uncharacterized protein n=1 Tax=Polyplax serrata TaxID=468196 RepID=A0ABR1AMF1_POLSC
MTGEWRMTEIHGYLEMSKGGGQYFIFHKRDYEKPKDAESDKVRKDERQRANCKRQFEFRVAQLAQRLQNKREGKTKLQKVPQGKKKERIKRGGNERDGSERVISCVVKEPWRQQIKAQSKERDISQSGRKGLHTDGQISPGVIFSDVNLLYLSVSGTLELVSCWN